jgi:Coenzyme PQQ synthesis protein D (PqqD)
MSRVTPASVVVASGQQLSREVGSETVILGLDEGKYFGLADVGSRIWSLVQEPRPVGDICRVIVDEYDVAPERCARDVAAFLARLAEQRLVEIRDS